MQSPAYLSRPVTDAVKGASLALVFVSHVLGYYAETGTELPAWVVSAVHCTLGPLGQMIVVMFLFYSGYGVMCAIKAKGAPYVETMPRKRILTVWANFMVAVCVFFAAQQALSPSAVNVRSFVLALVGWESIGNSNWYIFDILVLYALTYVAFTPRLSHGLSLALLCILCAAFAVALSHHKEYWWYDTLAAYPFGAAFACYRSKIEKAAAHHYWLLVGCALLVFIATYPLAKNMPGIMHNIRSVAFALAIVLATMKVPVRLSPLSWMGRNLFPLYIYQRLPMLALSTIGGGWLCRDFPLFFFAVCAAITVALAFAYKFIEIKLPAHGRAIAER